jgi:hypothetical protein
VELSLILDVAIAALLVATIVYAAILNRRLQGLRANKADFEAMIGEFNEATRRTEGSIQALRLAADQTAKALSVQVERGQALRDELAFLTNRADGAADRITGGGGSSKPDAPSPRPEVAAYAASPRPAPARQPQPAAQASAPPRPANTAAPPRPVPVAAPPADDAEEEGEGGRSKAEQDLLKALRELR